MIKLALPAGGLRGPLAELLAAAGLRVQGYGEGSRSYRLAMARREDVCVRVFRERDIPVQVALGNYDIGITSLAWVKEIQAQFPQEPLVTIAGLELGRSALFVAAHPTLDRMTGLGRIERVRIASEYPALAEAFARSARLRRYRVQGVWGAAEAYPPEDADIAITSVSNAAQLHESGLEPLAQLLDNSAWVVANAAALTGKELGLVLGPLSAGAGTSADEPALTLPAPIAPSANGRPAGRPRGDVLRIALPDGHQQRHVAAALAEAGLIFDGYGESAYVRRRLGVIDGLEIKVIRPQDMAALVATGEMDVAITGRDLLNEHLYQFPSSPVYEVLDLQRAQYNLSAVVNEDLPADDIGGAMAYWRSNGRIALRVAAEFPATADHYARSRHFGRYQVIPIAGASEGFVPEDAELLIEGTETGRTIAENKLKVIDVLYRSTTCLIANHRAGLGSKQKAAYEHVVSALRRSVSAPKV